MEKKYFLKFESIKNIYDSYKTQNNLYISNSSLKFINSEFECDIIICLHSNIEFNNCIIKCKKIYISLCKKNIFKNCIFEKKINCILDNTEHDIGILDENLKSLDIVEQKQFKIYQPYICKLQYGYTKNDILIKISEEYDLDISKIKLDNNKFIIYTNEYPYEIEVINDQLYTLIKKQIKNKKILCDNIPKKWYDNQNNNIKELWYNIEYLKVENSIEEYSLICPKNLKYLKTNILSDYAFNSCKVNIDIAYINHCSLNGLIGYIKYLSVNTLSGNWDKNLIIDEMMINNLDSWNPTYSPKKCIFKKYFENWSPIMFPNVDYLSYFDHGIEKTLYIKEFKKCIFGFNLNTYLINEFEYECKKKYPFYKKEIYFLFRDKKIEKNNHLYLVDGELKAINSDGYIMYTWIFRRIDYWLLILLFDIILSYFFHLYLFNKQSQ